jgi:hypothetical protein
MSFLVQFFLVYGFSKAEGNSVGEKVTALSFLLLLFDFQVVTCIEILF